MSEILNIKKALERRLMSITPAIATGFEGVEFDPPVDAMYQRVQFMIMPPVDPTFGVGYHREQLQLQVFLADIKGQGTSNVLERAELLRNTFAKGLALVEGTTRIFVLRTPQIGSVNTVQDRIIVPVLIPVIAEVYSD
jgi:Bacteriophage related domain of unknown function